jgi:hypothetical protein
MNMGYHAVERSVCHFGAIPPHLDLLNLICSELPLVANNKLDIHQIIISSNDHVVLLDERMQVLSQF